MGRSFISTHLAQESLVNGDDLRKYFLVNKKVTYTELTKL